MFTSVRSRVACILLSTAMLSAVVPGVAFAGVDDDPYGTSTTNPSYDSGVYGDALEFPHPDDISPLFPMSAPRQNWGKSLMPQFTFTDPDPNSPIGGFYYLIDRNPSTDMTVTAVPSYYHSMRREGTSFELGIVNILDVYNFDAPPGGWAYWEPGMRLPYEGHWYMHLAWELPGATPAEHKLSKTHHIPINIDLTAPLPVSKLVSRPSISYVGSTSKWFPTRRMHLTWEDKKYDALSGSIYFRILVDGKDKTGLLTGGSSFYNSLTLEDLPGGKHAVDLIVIDRALNESAKARTYYYSDPDTPTVSVTVPAAGERMPRNSTFKVNAFDEAGLQWVKYYVDGVLIGTTSTSPYSLTKNMSAFANGTRTLKVVVKDMYGRQVQTTRSFTLDKNAPSLTGMYDTPDPFYPVLQDGYKDTMSVRFTTNESVSAHLYIYNSSGARIRHIGKTFSAGTRSLVWDGADEEGVVDVGTFRYKVVLTDTAGNTTSSGYGSTTIRDYEIIRIAPNAVTVVPR